MKGRAFFLLTAVVVAVLLSTGVGLAESSSASQQQTSSLNQNPNVTVMTRNVYHGVDAEFAQVIGASPQQFYSKVANVYKGYYARNFPERADALAAEIEQTEPDVVGLQEAIMVRTQRPSDGTATRAGQVSLDYLQILLDKLQARGLHYKPVDLPLENFDIEAPADEYSPPDGPDFDLRHTDRIVMLVRNDGYSGLKVLNTNSGHFQTNCKLTTATGQQITIVRGWTSVDLSIQGKAVRFINTHLDGDCSDPTINLAQAREIIQGPVQDAKNKNLPVVLLGDLNSKADGSGTQTYAELLKPTVGLVDAWAKAGSGSGFTCCQNDDLLNTESVLSDRRDFVLYSNGSFQAREAEVVGADPVDRTPSGLWPSDHGGVVAKLRLLS